MPERCVREAAWQVLEKGSSGAREVCEREGAWQVLEKGSSGAREVCEKELGRVASLGGRGVREKSLGSEEVCERKGFILSLPFPSLRCTVGARERRLCSSSEDRHCSELGGV